MSTYPMLKQYEHDRNVKIEEIWMMDTEKCNINIDYMMNIHHIIFIGLRKSKLKYRYGYWVMFDLSLIFILIVFRQ